MGTLYSMIPVCVCDEVSEGIAPYNTSGWCFSEINIANLGRTLGTYSPQYDVFTTIEYFKAAAFKILIFQGHRRVPKKKC